MPSSEPKFGGKAPSKLIKALEDLIKTCEEKFGPLPPRKLKTEVRRLRTQKPRTGK